MQSCGRVFTWGSGLYGELGHGYAPPPAEQQLMRPRLVAGLPAGEIVSVSCGAAQTSCVGRDGAVWVCGSVENYAAPKSSPRGAPKAAAHGVSPAARATAQFLYTPARVWLPNAQQGANAGRRVKLAACGKSHLVLLDQSGDVWAVGSGGQGQLGHGKRSDLPTARPVLLGKRITLVAAGRYHSLAVSAYGAAWSWGSGEQGQLGQGEPLNAAIPKVVSKLLDRCVL
eukprot:SAG11_NODE_8542_length_1003_cov_1.146018_1_plen_226_part_10